MKRLGLGLVFLAAVAHAQPVDVPALVKLVETQPANMDRSEWKEKRRDAAKKLVASKDKRAVPVLIKVADEETFDVIGEIAIEGLGNLGDPSAIPVLQKIAGDNARDKTQRDLAKKALAKLGASADVKPDGPPDPPNGGGDPLVTPKPDRPSGSGLLGEKPTGDLPELPPLADDAIGASERLTFALGSAQFGFDTVRERISFDFDVAGLYAKRVERERVAWGWDAAAHVVTGYISPPGRSQSRGTQVNLGGNGEVRLYSGPVYGIGKAALAGQISYVSFKDGMDPANDDSDTRFTGDLQLALGGGYGRLLDVGGAIRVRRLSRVLDTARALGKPIDKATARKLQLTWWALRGERSSYRALISTVRVLREAGVLLVEPDAGLSYEILAVLRDSQLFMRPSGLDIQLVFGEGYLIRPGDDMDPNLVPAGEEGRVEQVLFSAGYGKQLADDKLEISGAAYGRVRLLAPENQNSPYAAGVTARLRRFTYGEHGDPYGMFDVAADLRASNDGNAMNDMVPGQDDDTNVRLAGTLGFTWWLNQASGFRLAANVAVDGGELFIGAQLSVAYGWLDATFAGL